MNRRMYGTPSRFLAISFFILMIGITCPRIDVTDASSKTATGYWTVSSHIEKTDGTSGGLLPTGDWVEIDFLVGAETSQSEFQKSLLEESITLYLNKEAAPDGFHRLENPEIIEGRGVPAFVNGATAAEKNPADWDVSDFNLTPCEIVVRNGKEYYKYFLLFNRSKEALSLYQRAAPRYQMDATARVVAADPDHPLAVIEGSGGVRLHEIPVPAFADELEDIPVGRAVLEQQVAYSLRADQDGQYTQIQSVDHLPDQTQSDDLILLRITATAEDGSDVLLQEIHSALGKGLTFLPADTVLSFAEGLGGELRSLAGRTLTTEEMIADLYDQSYRWTEGDSGYTWDFGTGGRLVTGERTTSLYLLATMNPASSPPADYTVETAARLTAPSAPSVDAEPLTLPVPQHKRGSAGLERYRVASPSEAEALFRQLVPMPYRQEFSEYGPIPKDGVFAGSTFYAAYEIDIYPSGAEARFTEYLPDGMELLQYDSDQTGATHYAFSLTRCRESSRSGATLDEKSEQATELTFREISESRGKRSAFVEKNSVANAADFGVKASLIDEGKPRLRITFEDAPAPTPPLKSRYAYKLQIILVVKDDAVQQNPIGCSTLVYGQDKSRISAREEIRLLGIESGQTAAPAPTLRLQLTKKDLASKIALGGYELQAYYAAADGEPDRELTDSAGRPVIFREPSDSFEIIPEGFTAGVSGSWTILLVERIPPENYHRNDAPIRVEILADQNGVLSVESISGGGEVLRSNAGGYDITVYSIREYSHPVVSLSLQRVDAQGKPSAQSTLVYQIYRTNGTTGYTLPVRSDGATDPAHLTEGQYYISEVDMSGNHPVIGQTYGYFSVNKMEGDSRLALVMDPGRSSGNLALTEENGRYRLRVTATAAVAVPAQPVTGPSPVSEDVPSKTPQTISLRVQVVDPDGDFPTSQNVGFRIEQIDGDSLFSLQSGADGYTEIVQAGEGRYRLLQAETPEGYLQSETPHGSFVVEMGADGVIRAYLDEKEPSRNLVLERDGDSGYQLVAGNHRSLAEPEELSDSEVESSVQDGSAVSIEDPSTPLSEEPASSDDEPPLLPPTGSALIKLLLLGLGLLAVGGGIGLTVLPRKKK